MPGNSSPKISTSRARSTVTNVSRSDRLRRVTHRGAGLRSFIADHDPMVGRDPDVHSFSGWQVGRFGITTAPAPPAAGLITTVDSPSGPDLRHGASVRPGCVPAPAARSRLLPSASPRTEDLETRHRSTCAGPPRYRCGTSGSRYARS